MKISDELKEKAAVPTRQRIQLLIAKVPDKIHPLIEEISASFLQPEETMSEIRRRAEATDWHCRLLRREIGLSPGELLRACRLDTSIPVLRDTTMTTRRVARLVGYLSPRPLEKQIRDSWACSPKELRNSLREIQQEFRVQIDEFLSWYFWVKYHRGEIKTSDCVAAMSCLRRRFSSDQ